MASALDDEELSIPTSASARRSHQHSQRHHQRRDRDREQAIVETRGKQQSIERHGSIQQLGAYTILRTLGEGSFGKVKLAVNQLTRQQVAFKIINRKKLVTRDMAGRIEREIKYLSLLRHPHIIKLYTVITTSSEIVMVLEFAGMELFDYIVQHGKLTEDKARRFFQQIVCAVEYCHRHKIVHRDLKPENLLLDNSQNVKIADFGLSNIMTDGNFLKTSCGSPNYAAPEVISGKLYAGPEVDVWSCGIILYVLLVGRLPFDDEFIPNLFRKIAAGHFYMPPYLSPGAQRLIRRMLVVNPVQRITIAEIRQDPWFTTDLAPYLQIPAEEFYNTGVDPNKALDIGALTSSAPATRLHESVVVKLGKTMGYAKEDVQDALTKDVPSAIKDAYNIIRENQLMKENPVLAQETTLQPFLAQSPPVNTTSYLTPANFPRPPTARSPPPSSAEAPSISSMTSSMSTSTDHRAYISTIAVLPSSLPEFHRAYMEGTPQSANSPGPNDLNTPPIDSPALRSPQEQDAAKRRLRPHSRSQIALDKSATVKPEQMTPIPAKKAKGTKWQFGIRSRNSPSEAMLALYKALLALGAEWEIPRKRMPHTHSSRGRSGSSSGSSGDDDEYFDEANEERDEEQNWSDDDVPDLDDTDHNRTSSISVDRGRRSRRRDQDYGPHNDWGYDVPVDPWVIRARFKITTQHSQGGGANSSHSSRVDLTAVEEELERRKAEEEEHQEGGKPSTFATAVGHVAKQIKDMKVVAAAANPDSGASLEQGEDLMYVYLTIQLYTIDVGHYLVDFKSSGYERLEKELVREARVELSGGGAEWRLLREGESPEAVGARKGAAVREREVLVGQGQAQEDKNATSPFPFLDVASRLVSELAEGKHQQQRAGQEGELDQ